MRGQAPRTAERRTVELRHRGHLVTLSLSGAVLGVDRCEGLFERVLASIELFEAPSASD